jgi:hypothetical protein
LFYTRLFVDIISRSILADIRDLQRMRAKSSGLSAEELALGEQTHKDANMKTFGDDPLYLKTGGVFELKKMKRSVLYSFF